MVKWKCCFKILIKGGFFLKDDKELEKVPEASEEEIVSTLDKTDDYNQDELQDELEKLAETFKTELQKAKEQGSVKIGEMAVVDENNNVIPKEELCECCGERRKDTSVYSYYQYCSECRELMKRYPLNFASVIIAIAVVLVAVLGVSGFITDFDGYNSARLAKEADSENKRFSAVEYYDEAIAFFDEKEIVPKKLYKESAMSVFATLPGGVASFKDVSTRVENALTDFESKLPIYSSYTELRDNALIMYNTFNSFYAVLNNTEYADLSMDDKEAFKKIYDEISALADKDLTIEAFSGDESKTVKHNKAAILFSQFMFAYSYNEFDTAYDCLKELWENYPEYVQMFGYEFATIEIQSGNYKNAVKVADAVKANNAEDSSPYVIYSYNERMKGEFDKSIKKADEGILIDSANPDLYRQKAISLMLKKDFEGAVKELETGLSYGEYGVIYYTYLVALTELNDTAKLEKVNEILKNSGLDTPERVQQYLDGALTCKQLFMEGTGDIE